MQRKLLFVDDASIPLVSPGENKATTVGGNSEICHTQKKTNGAATRNLDVLVLSTMIRLLI